MSDINSQIVTGENTGNQHFEAYEEVNGTATRKHPTSSGLTGRKQYVLDAHVVTDVNVIDVLVNGLNFY